MPVKRRFSSESKRPAHHRKGHLRWIIISLLLVGAIVYVIATVRHSQRLAIETNPQNPKGAVGSQGAVGQGVSATGDAASTEKTGVVPAGKARPYYAEKGTNAGAGNTGVVTTTDSLGGAQVRGGQRNETGTPNPDSGSRLRENGPPNQQ